jgi:hypothetical protein
MNKRCISIHIFSKKLLHSENRVRNEHDILIEQIWGEKAMLIQEIGWKSEI